MHRHRIAHRRVSTTLRHTYRTYVHPSQEPSYGIARSPPLMSHRYDGTKMVETMWVQRYKDKMLRGSRAMRSALNMKITRFISIHPIRIEETGMCSSCSSERSFLVRRRGQGRDGNSESEHIKQKKGGQRVFLHMDSVCQRTPPHPPETPYSPTPNIPLFPQSLSISS